MPEYLAPGVYVEEIDTGSKPIEGVSTSTAGMVGVTERGPVNVPILITGFAEYQRWFGGYLRKDDFPDTDRERPLRFLPHAVEGFFTNGGKRAYVVRVLKVDEAENASTFLFDRNAEITASTQLLRDVAKDSKKIDVAHTGLTKDNWIQIGERSEVEFREIGADPKTANQVVLRLPLSFSYDPAVAATTADAFDPPTLTPDDTINLDAPVTTGATEIRVSSSNEAIPAGAILRLNTAGAKNEEFVITAAAVPADPAKPRTVGLNAATVLAHESGETVEVFDPANLPAPAASKQLSVPTAVGDTVLFVDDHTGFTTPGHIVRISDGAHTEARLIGELSALSLPLGIRTYADYPKGATVEAVTLTDDDPVTDRVLEARAVAGGNVLRLDKRQDLEKGHVLRVGSAADTMVEYVTIQSIPDRLPDPDRGIVVLTSTLQSDHIQGAEVRKQDASGIASAPAVIVLPAQRNSTALAVSASFNVANPIRVLVGNQIYYHRLSAASTALTPFRVTLSSALELPHLAGSPVVARTPLLLVQALDAGRWGNRLRVSVPDDDPALVNTQLREVLDSHHIRLNSATGVEAGTILEHTDATGTVTPVKVQGIDRQNDALITLEQALPGSAGKGDAVRSREFQLDVYLLRQPDPAVPMRSEDILASESFRYLSMDHRHSRFIHKVIGTTWSNTPGTTDDDDYQGLRRPLRREDRRSEGESWLIRIRDTATDREATEALRLGPVTLVRHELRGGSDAAEHIEDKHYRGEEHPEPENRTGLASLRNREEISIVAIPGRTSASLQGALIEHCELMRYRFAVLDGPQPPGDSLNDVQAQRQQFDTKYAALYHPWPHILDPFPANLAQIANYPIPPSGHVLGVYARTDIERGVHKAPANEVVRGIIGLRRTLNKGEHDILNPYPVNINVIRDFRPNNRGIRVYGARCITSDPDWKYVNVRRLLIFIEASIDRGLQWVVFEPNAEPLWARVRRSVSNFLTTVWRNGALEGTKREEAFFVKCDRTTMTQTDIDNGRLICVIGVAPVKPAEFVIVRIGLWTAHAEE